MNELSEPLGQHLPDGPENGEEEPEADQQVLNGRISEKLCPHREREEHQDDSGEDVEEKPEYLPPERNLWLRSGKFATAALGANIGESRINVVSRAEFDVIAAPAEVAEERLARRHMPALEAMFHDFKMVSFKSA